MRNHDSLPTGMFDSFDSVRFGDQIVRQPSLRQEVGLALGPEPFNPFARLIEKCETTDFDFELALEDDRLWDDYAAHNPAVLQHYEELWPWH